MTAALARVDRPRSIARASDPMAEWHAMREQAAALVRSGFLPRAIKTPEQAIAIIQTGKELGIGPMQALRAVHIVEGKPTLSSELMAGLVLSKLPNAVLRPVETTADACTVEAARPGQQPTRFTFTMSDARAAGLTAKDNWKKYPRAMLQRRALAEAARSVFPDCTMGLYDPDELGAVTDEHGAVVELPPTDDRRGNPVYDATPPPEPRSDNVPLSEPRNSGWGHPVPTVQFGKNKGKPITALNEKQLKWYIGAAKETLADQSKARWHDKERAWLEALETEMISRTPQPANPAAADNMHDSYLADAEYTEAAEDYRADFE